MQWLHTQMALLDAARAIVSFAANWLLQSTLLIAAGLAIAWLLRRRGSALQSAIYRTTLAAVVVCPLATALLARGGVSGWSVELPVAWTYEELKSLPAENAEETRVIPNAAPESEPLPVDFGNVTDVGWDKRVERAPAHHAESWHVAQPPSAVSAAGDPGFPQPRAAVPHPAAQSAIEARQLSVFHLRTFGLAALALSLTWLMVSAVLLARLALAWRRLGQLRCAATVAEPTAQQTCRQLSALLSVAAPEVRCSPYLGSPCLAGLLCPVVLLPEAEASLPLRDVLIHELAHLRRRDGWWNLLVRLTEALFFYQPLLWALARRLESAAEEVCDDYVVQFGGDREEYARGLLEIAELSSPPVGAAGVAMVSLRSILARRITRIVDSSRSLSTRAGNLLLIVVVVGGLIGTMAAGFVGLGSRHSLAEAAPTAERVANTADEQSDAEQAGDVKSQEAPQAKPEDAQPASEKPGEPEEKQYHGKIVAADGRPLAGAEIWFAVSPYEHAASTVQGTLRRVAVSDSRGDFSFRLKPPENADQFPIEWTKFATVVAKAPNHGFDWLPLVVFEQDAVSSERRIKLQQELDKRLGPGRFAGRVLELPREARPVRGRLVDLQGRPLKGVAVMLESIQNPDSVLLRGGFEKASPDIVSKALHAPALSQGWLGRRNWQALIPPVKTNDNGEFSLAGLGRDQVATVTLSGERVEAERFFIVGTEMETKRVPHISLYPKGAQDSFVGVDFSLAVGPAIPVSGVVTEFKTGKPIAGVVVHVERLFSRESLRSSSSQLRLSTSHIRTVTDEQGRYRLDGIPPGEAHVLNAIPPTTEPWLIAKQTISLDPGQSSAAVNIQVFRGIWIEGKVTDADTGEAIKGSVDYLALRTNKNIPQEFGLRDGWEMGRFPIGAEGRYRTAGLPGPGVLFVSGSSGKKVYPLGVGAEQIEGYDANRNYLPTTPTGWPLSNWNLLQFIDPKVGVESHHCDLTLSAGGSLAGRVVAPNDAPGASIEAMGLVEKSPFFKPLKDDKFTVTDYRPDVPRNLFFRTSDQSLIGYLHLEGKPPADLTVRLQPSVTVRGSLIETENEEPAAGYRIYCDSSQQGKFRVDDVETDKEGRFEIKGLMAGNVYKMDSANVQRFISHKNGFTIDLTHAKPGDVIELGDVTGKNAKRIPAAPDQSESADDAKKASSDRPGDTKTLRGRVVDAKGQPVNQARVRIFHVDSESGTRINRGRILAETRSDALGEFSIDYANRSAFAAREHFTQPSMIVLADADGYACDWHELEPGEQKLALTLSSDDVPLEGRVLDLEGRPIQGVRVSVERVSQAAKELGEWIEAAKKNPASVAEEWMMQPINSPKRRNAPKVARFPGSKELWAAPSGFLPSTVTDVQGRFRFTGLGRNRLVRLQLEGGSIAKTWLNAVTHEMPPVPYPENDPRFRVPTCFGRRFDFTTEPDQPISGVVRDADGGRALRGVEVRLEQYADSLLVVEGFLATLTDDEGRYTLRGVPKPHDPDRTQRLRIIPPDEEPYFRTDVPVAKHGGLDAIECDVRLKRAIWLRGRVIDAVTRKPILGLVEYYPFLSNKAAADYPNFVPGMHSVEGDRYPTRDDGTFRLPALPGRGLVAFIAQRADRYPEADGADRIDGLQEAEGTAGGVYHFAGTELTTAVREVDVPAGGGDFICNIELKPLDVAQVSLVDPEGRPLSGVVTRRGAPIHIAGAPYDDPWSSGPLSMAAAEIVGPRDQYRTAMFLHRERKLGAAVSLSRDRDPPRQVVLRACGAISGRIVDADHKPVASFYVDVNAAAPAGERPTGWARTSFDSRHQIDFVQTDEDGRFRLELVPPEIAYVIRGNLGPATLEKTTPVLQPGQSLELGDLVLQPPKPAAPREGNAAAKPQATPITAPTALASDEDKKDAAVSAPSKVKTVRGRVVDAKGQAVVGARVRMYRNYWLSAAGTVGAAPQPQWLADTRSDANGRFSVEFKPLSASSESQAKARGFSETMGVFATAEGFGFALRQTDPAANDELELRLAPDSSPIEGRLLDLEGRPVRGARVTVRAVDTFDEDPQTLDDWLAQIRAAAAANREVDDMPRGRTVEFDSFFAPFPVAATDDEGRFTFWGIGADRVAYLEIEGAKIATTWLPVVTRAIGPLPLASGLLRFPAQVCYLRFSTQTCYGARCEVVTAPEQPIEGVVRDADSGQPLADTEVRLDWNDNVFAQRGLTTKTDAEGRYRLSGLLKPPGEGREVELRVLPAQGQPYFRTEVKVPRRRGVDAVTCDVPLRRGVTLRGRVTDRKTGQPVRAAVRYYPFLTNQAAAQYANFEPGVRKIGYDDRYATDTDGRFVIPAVRGRGVLTVVAEQGDRYTLADGAEAIANLLAADGERPNVYHLSGLNQDNAVREVEIPRDAEELTMDVQLTPLPVVRLLLVDQQGNELRGVETQGLAPMNPFADHWSNEWREPLPTANAELFGPETGDSCETLFLDRAQNLGAMVRFASADASTPAKRIVLRPCGSIRGRILDGRGRGVAGAWVDATVVPNQGTLPQGGKPAAASPQRFTWQLTLNLVKADADGRFELKCVPPGARYAITAFAEKRNERWQAVTAEIKPGAVVELGDVAPEAQQPDGNENAASTEIDGQKVNNDVPIHGRVLTLEGKPVAGAKVSMHRVGRCAGDSLKDYIEAFRAGRLPYDFERLEVKPPEVPDAVFTDEEGRFDMRGFGAERVVELNVEGPGIEYTHIAVMTRETDTVAIPRDAEIRPRPDRAFGATFDYLAAPSRPIAGTVRERGTGRPVAGVTIRGLTNHAPQTDEAGRFQLLGYAKGERYFIRAEPKLSEYFSAAVEVKDTPGLSPLVVDIELAPGIAASGKVRLAGSGWPYAALVEYYPLYPNPYVERLGEHVARPCSSALCDDHGTFRLPVLPGPGVLAFRGDGSDYYDLLTRARVTRKQLAEFFADDREHGDEEMLYVAMGGQSMGMIGQHNYNGLLLINPEADAKLLEREVELTVGRTVTGQITGPDGRPMAGARVHGLTTHPFHIDQLAGADFTVKALDPASERTLVFEIRDHNLAAYQVVDGDEAGPLTVRLAACGLATGRLLDASGEPLARKQFSVGRPRLSPPEFTPTADASGKFVVNGLVPGLKYSLRVSNGGAAGAEAFAEREVVVGPGETIDLGDIVVGKDKSVSDANKKAAATRTAKETIVRGRVLLPDGKPAAGAELYWTEIESSGHRTKTKAVRRGLTNDKGQFEIALNDNNLPSALTPQSVVARKAGFGVAWLRITREQIPPDVTLQLVDDRPIRGRVIDTEGRPVGGASVAIANILASPSGDLGPFFVAWKQNWRDAFTKVAEPGGLYATFDAMSALTDTEGRFEISGVGVERVAALEIRSTGYGYEQLYLVNRDGFDAESYNQVTLSQRMPAMNVRGGMSPRLTCSPFEHVLVAEMVVRGKVLNSEGSPVAGASVYSHSAGWAPDVSAMTDSSGRYGLHGHPRGADVFLSVAAPEASTLLDSSLQRQATATQTELVIDVELERGVAVEGRVFDRVTGKGVQAGVQFVVLPDNHFVDKDDRRSFATQTDKDGQFRLLVVPGPGVLMAQAHGGARIAHHDICPYRQASFSAEDSQRVPTTINGDDRYFTLLGNSIHFLTNENAVKVLDLAPDSKSATCNLPVDPGKTVTIVIEDEQGQPVKDAFVSGLADAWPNTFRLPDAACTIYALGADRPRRVCLLHPERRLAASVTLTGDEQEPMRIRLAGSASMNGRSLAPDGEPLADALVQINYAGRSASELLRFSELEHAPLKTDGEGRFLADNIVPGERFSLDFKLGETFYRVGERRELSAGQKLDLGDVTVKPVR